MRKNEKRKLLITLLLVISMLVVSTISIYAVSVIKLNKSKVYLNEGESVTLTLKNVKKSTKVVWTSIDTKVAKVGSSGTVTGKSQGETVITAKYNNKKYSCKVYITKDWKKEEISALIDEAIKKSGNLGMTKEEVTKLINEKIAKAPTGGSNVIYTPTTNQSVTVIPSGAFDYKTTKGNFIHVNGIEVLKIEKNDFSLFASSDKGRFDYYSNYSFSVKISGNVPESYAGKFVCIGLSDENNTSQQFDLGLDDFITIKDDGSFEAEGRCVSNHIPEQIILTQMSIIANEQDFIE